jgi:hypothetical protein
MTRYRCLRRSQIRAGPDMTSEKRGILHQGAVVNALDTLKLPSGTTRIHFAFGWVSEATGSGLKVMAQLEDEEVVAADEFFHAPPESTADAPAGAVRKACSVARAGAAKSTGSEAKPHGAGIEFTAIPAAHRIAHHRHGALMVSRMVEAFKRGKEAYSALGASAPVEQQQVEALLAKDDYVLELHKLHSDLDIDHSGDVDVEDVAPLIDGADTEAQELIRLADEDASGTLTFIEFASIYLNAITDGKLSHSSDGFVDIISGVERQTNLAQITTVAQALVKACELGSGSQLSHTLQELRKMLHEVEIHDASLSNQASRVAGPTDISTVNLEAIEQFQNELDLELEHEEALEETAAQEAEVGAEEAALRDDATNEALRPMTPANDRPGSGLGLSVSKRESQHQDLARLYGLFPTIDSKTIDEILGEAGSIDGALQVLKDVSGATDQIENKADTDETPQTEQAEGPAPAPAGNADDVAIAQGVEEFPLPDDPSNLDEALDQFMNAQHVNQVAESWSHVRKLSGVPADATGLAFFDQLKDMVAGSIRSKAQQVTSLLDNKVARREAFRKLSGKSVCVVGAGPVGLRCAIELAMCGASVTIIEQRRAFTRANILKMWPFLVHDLRGLGAKIFFPQYCTGGLMHIGTRRLQQILLKDALLLGVEVHYGLQFQKVLKPDKAAGKLHWTLDTGPMMGRDGLPRDPPELYAAAQAEAAKLGERGFDSVFIGIGQQVPVEAALPNGGTQLSFTPVVAQEGETPLFELKKVQYSQALGMVTHFQNNSTVEENCIQEQGGIARQFNMEMFDSLQRTTMCELENVVYYRGESHYWVMTPTTESLEKTGVLTKLAPTRDQLLAESSEEMQALLRFCFSHINCGEVIDVTHASEDDDDEHGLFDLVENVMGAKEGPEITKRKVLWRHHIDDSKGQPRFRSSDPGLTGKSSARAQSKALAGLAHDLMKIVQDGFPQERWPKPPAGSRLFKTHGRSGEGSTYIVDNIKMMAYARHVAGHFRPYFKKKDPATGEYVAQFTSVAEGAQIFNFDQILEAKKASTFVVHDGMACNINLIGDSLKEPFWPQGTGVNRGVLGAFDAIFTLIQAADQDLSQEAVRTKLLEQREQLQIECFRADTPYEKDGVMMVRLI